MFWLEKERYHQKFLEIDGYKVLDMPNNSTQRGPWNPIAAFVRGAGTAVYGDEDFVDGSNSVNVYNNQGGSGVQHFHEEDGTTLNQIAPNSSGKVIRIYNNGNNTSPGRGGFYQTISSANNQTFVTMPNGDRYFKSYNSWVARWIAEVDIVELDSHTWDYSRTTGKYRNQILGENTAETRKGIKEAEMEAI